MDVLVHPENAIPGMWQVTSLLGCPLGTIYHDGPDQFTIRAVIGRRMEGVEPIHRSLSEAMTAIARQTRGTCHLGEGAHTQSFRRDPAPLVRLKRGQSMLRVVERLSDPPP